MIPDSLLPDQATLPAVHTESFVSLLLVALSIDILCICLCDNYLINIGGSYRTSASKENNCISFPSFYF